MGLDGITQFILHPFSATAPLQAPPPPPTPAAPAVPTPKAKTDSLTTSAQAQKAPAATGTAQLVSQAQAKQQAHGNAVQGFFDHLVKSAEAGLDHGIDWVENKAGEGAQARADQMRGVPVLGQLAQAQAWVDKQAVQVLGGVVKGAGTLVGGVANMAVHPVDSVKGLYAMAEHLPLLPVNPLRVAHAGYDVAFNGKDAAKTLERALNPADMLKDDVEFGKTLVKGVIQPYRDSIDQGKGAEALGRGIFDIGSLFIGAGEVEAGAKGASLAARSAEAAGVMGREAEVAGAVGRGAELASQGAEMASVASHGAEVAEAAKIFKPGLEVKLTRSSGAVDSGWRVVAGDGDNFILSKEGVGVKRATLGDLVRDNPERLPPRALSLEPGQSLRIRRSSGALDDGWKVKQVEGDHVLLEKPGVGTKEVGLDQVREANPELGASAAKAFQSLDDIQVGQSFKIRRSSGAVDEGWKVQGVAGDQVFLGKPGVGVKAVSKEQLARENPEIFGEPIAERPPAAAFAPGAALKQSEGYLGRNRISAGTPIADGFKDGGRGMRIAADGTASSGREIIVVDRARDAALRDYLSQARQLRSLPEAERAQALAQYVDAIMSPAGRSQAVANVEQWSSRLTSKEVMLGDVGKLGGGVCRHRALLFKVLGDEAGLNVDLVRGTLKFPGGGGAHAWNELTLQNGQKLVVDVMNPSKDFALPKLADAPFIYIDGQGQQYGRLGAVNGAVY